MDKRVRTGCVTCRKRRVKCDEAKPVCGRCRAGNFVCEGYNAPRRAPGSPSSSVSTSRRSPSQEGPPVSGLSWRQANWRQEQLPLYHHFVTTTVVRLFRNDHVSFWRDQVAQMSYGMDFVYEALLAIGAVHRATLLNCKYGQNRDIQEAAKSRVLGLRAYGNALRMLPDHLRKDSGAETYAVLSVLVLLTYFECIMENPKGAFRHLWAGIQLLRRSEKSLSNTEVSNLVPVFDAMLRLDFLAQKLVPYASSSFLRCSDRAMMESPFWNRASPEFSGISQSDQIAAERYRLIQLICAHNKLSRVVWGCWCPISERPSRDELMGFYSEMLMWKASSPATYARCDGLELLEGFDATDIDSLSMPPPACHFPSNETALNISMYNAYLGCAVAMIGTTDPDPAARELEAFHLVYQNLCIAAGLIDRHNEQSNSPYKPCDAISAGISVVLFHGARRCFSRAWQEWSIAALRLIGREGLFNGLTSANTIEIMCQLQASMRLDSPRQLSDFEVNSELGPIRNRLIPLLMPRGDDDQLLAIYLLFGNAEFEGDEHVVQVAAKATWKEDVNGTMDSLKLEVYDSAFADFPILPDRPQALDLFFSWRQAVESGWHGYLGTEIQDGFLQS